MLNKFTFSRHDRAEKLPKSNSIVKFQSIKLNWQYTKKQMFSPRNENLDLLVQIKFLNLFYIHFVGPK